jgi:hypothetical protein
MAERYGHDSGAIAAHSQLGGFPARVEVDRTYLYGYGLLILTFGFFVVLSYILVVSKLLPPTGHPILDWIRSDMYYCVLLPLSIPAGVVFVYLNWMSLKFFRHN